MQNVWIHVIVHMRTVKGPWADAQADLGLRCLHMLRDTFLYGPLPPTPTNFAWLESSFITTSGSSSSSSKSEVGAGLLKYYDKITQAVLGFDEEMIKVKYTVFNLITAHTPLSTLSSNSLVFKLQPVYFYLLVFKPHRVDWAVKPQHKQTNKHCGYSKWNA